jgi:hypothetical protein
MVTFSGSVTCPTGAPYAYSNSGGGGAVPLATCAAVGGHPNEVVLAPANGATLAGSVGGTDSLTYTQGSPTTTTATFAGANGGPSFEPSPDVFQF